MIKKIITKKYYSRIPNFKNYLRSLFLFGFKYHCNFCKGHFRKLLPIGLKNDVAMNLIGGGLVILHVPDAILQTERDWFIGISLIKQRF